MSPVRRTFCLLVTFDLIFTFIVWVIYVQIVGKGFNAETFIKEAIHYTFPSSLFDTVLCSACRFVPLLLAYALLRIHHPWVVALTTFGTCAFLVTKVFLFDFSQTHDNPLSYMSLLVSFIIAWIETWFLDFKVLPREQKARERMSFLHPEQDARLLLGGEAASHVIHHPHDQQYYSPVDSREGSDDDDGEHQYKDFVSVSSRRASVYSLKDPNYPQTAQESWDKAWEIMHTADGWKLMNGITPEEGCVYSRSFSGYGKIFKLEAHLDSSPQEVFDELILNADATPTWNPTVLECKTIEVLDDHTDVAYNLAADAVGGLVSSRDFVNLRYWQVRNDVILSSCVAVTHSDMPPTKHVRAENKPGGLAFKPVPGAPDRCLFIWIINTDLKGWLPQYAVDQALAGTLLEFLRHLKQRMAQLKRGHAAGGRVEGGGGVELMEECNVDASAVSVGDT
ncbi:StAR-related lipid transfer protein 3 [Lamellibrachia satsuma]|nr:StAR-related lipid transfer protein 3 [Lamellibrachia satsuma]